MFTIRQKTVDSMFSTPTVFDGFKKPLENHLKKNKVINKKNL
jgi:hypothetical protein